jgi:O-antigen/teichoic acid export membrane protein
LWQAASSQLQLQKHPLGYAILSWSSNLLNVSVSLLLVIGFGLGWEGRVSGQVLASVGIGLASVFVLKRLVGGPARYNSAYVKDAVSFGAPTVPYALLDRAMRFGDRSLIAAIVNLEQAGFYALGAQVGNILNQGVMSIVQAWQPWLYEELGKGTARSQHKAVVSLYALASLILGGAFCLWAAVQFLFPILIGDEFQGALVFVPWLCAAFGLRGVASLMAQLVVYSKQTRELTKVAVVVGVFNLALEVVLIWQQGAVGAARATCLAYALNVLLMWRTARRLVPLPGY